MPPSGSTVRRPRPEPVQARSLETRRRLVRATLDAWVERGFARASTTEIVRRAGVSQGALFKHFPSKADLVAEAVATLFEGLVEGFRQAFARIAEGEAPRARIAKTVRILWDVFRQPGLLAAYEVYVAARTDPDLRSALAPVLAAHRARLREEAASLFPEAARTRADFDAVVDGLLNAVQGAALGAVALSDPSAEEAHLRFLEEVARGALLEESGSEPDEAGG